MQLLLRKAEGLLADRLEQLEARLQAGEEAAWSEFLEVVGTLVALLPSLTPERGGAMLTTGEMAARLGVAPKTLLRHKARGRIHPAVERGKLLRWNGSERLS